jgi:cytochrome c6
MKATRFALVLAILALMLAPTLAFAADGAAVYKTKCATCHGADGAGQTGMGKTLKLRALGSADVQKTTDADLEKIIADGKGKMPGYKGKLSADEIKAVVAFIRTLKK